MTSLLFPDINVWVALNSARHAHHQVAARWYRATSEQDRIVFCRQTQLGMFRLLSTPAIMEEEALSLRACWAVFDQWVETGQVMWANEPQGLDQHLRSITQSTFVSPKAWMDAYLAAFAETASLTLVTFDRALAGKAEGVVLLG